MPFREALAKLALSDAARFERETAETLRGILASCRDERLRRALEEILAEEEAHCSAIRKELARRAPGKQPPQEERERLPRAPNATVSVSDDVCKALRRLLEKEEASATFYTLLAERTPIPAVRDVFLGIAAAERGHAAKLAALARRL